MTTPQFATNQVFGSHEELMNWVKNLANSLGVVIITKRSNKYPNGFMYKVVLMCDRGGKYNAKESSKVSGTKKTDCPFELEGKYSTEYNFWTLTVICDKHNHQPVQYMEGHPYAKRLCDDEFSLVADLTRMNVAPRDILAILKERNLSNVSTIRTIYNARSKIRMIEQAGKTPMQVLMSLFHHNGYFCEFSTSGNKLENLFFVHPTSFDIWRAFPHVLIIDATYKTNRYNMPFVQIVGVTSTSKTFSIAFAFMHDEQKDTYAWVLNCLKLTLDKCMHPRVIVTDREMALVSACKEVFPCAAQLLCRWHIEQNIIKNCRQSVRSAHDWDRFFSLWKRLEDSLKLEDYTENYKEFESFLTKYPRVLKYVSENWLVDKYKEKFVSVWIDQHLNFGNNTTNRVESQHAKLKKYLKSSTCSLDKFVGCIDRIVQSQHTEIKASFEKSRIVRIHQHNIRCFKLLRGFVSNEALDRILADYTRWNGRQVDSSDCGCRLRKSCGLPCACEMSMYISTGQSIPLDSIDVFWRKLDISPTTSVQNDDVSCDGELEDFIENFDKQPVEKKKSLFRKLKDIIGLGTTDLQEPRVKKNTRGRPSLKKTQQKRRVDPIRQESCRYSCSTTLNVVGFDSTEEPARHSSYGMHLNKKPMIDLNELPYDFESSYTVDLNEVPTMNGSSILDDIPKVFHPYITNIQNVWGDGNCGYRALAVCLRHDEENYYEYIRQEMKEEFETRRDFYSGMFTRDIDLLYRTLCFVGSPCPVDLWMQMPEAGVLIANKLGVIVHSLSMSGSSTIFPFWKGPEEFQHHKTLTIALVNNQNHYVMVELQGEYPMPAITPYWHFRNISPSAAR